jgi:hypothetical protein
LRSGEIIDADLIGFFEQIDGGHNIPKFLAVPSGEQFEITSDVQNELRNFVLVALDAKIGRFFGKDKALVFIAGSRI